MSKQQHKANHPTEQTTRTFQFDISAQIYAQVSNKNADEAFRMLQEKLILICEQSETDKNISLQSFQFNQLKKYEYEELN